MTATTAKASDVARAIARDLVARAGRYDTARGTFRCGINVSILRETRTSPWFIVAASFPGGPMLDATGEGVGSPYCNRNWCEAHITAGAHSANCPNL